VVASHAVPVLQAVRVNEYQKWEKSSGQEGIKRYSRECYDQKNNHNQAAKGTAHGHSTQGGLFYGDRIMIKAIETIYDGYRFRSRLEARWAVFFDAAGIEYEYEKEGFKLDSGWYLPDFWLPKQLQWIEIKPYNDGKWPNDPRFDEVWENDENFVVITGNPFRDEGPRGYFDFGYEGFVKGDCGRLWCQCYQCGYLGLEFDGCSDRLPCSCDKSQDKRHNFDAEILTEAYTAAKQARFEHGEKP